MLRVEGADPAVLSRRMHHHGEQYRPLIDALMYGLVLESTLSRDADEHVLRQSRNGPGSFSLRTASGSEFHFRPNGNGSILVRDAYRNGVELAELRTPAQARRFMRRLTP